MPSRVAAPRKSRANRPSPDAAGALDAPSRRAAAPQGRGALTSADRRRLRSLAHSLEPVVEVGRHGLGAAVRREIEAALDHHELIKVRLSPDREERATWTSEIAAGIGCEVVGAIGRVVILYREAVDPERRRIELG